MAIAIRETLPARFCPMANRCFLASRQHAQIFFLSGDDGEWRLGIRSGWDGMVEEDLLGAAFCEKG